MSILKITAAALVSATSLAAQNTRDLSTYLMADRAAEIALARTAAPKEISDSASVLVLTPTGFVQAARGTNGFTCVVFRSFAGKPEDADFWNPRVRAPHCFNPPAVRTVMPEGLKKAELALSGVAAPEIGSRIQRAFASRELPTPAAGAMAYMLSPKQHLADANPHWTPHLMFFYDKTLPGSTFGAGGQLAPMINASAGDPTSPVITLLIPVQRWSDGTPAAAHKP